MWSIFFLINDLLLKGSIFCWGTYVFGLNLPSILKKCLINVGNGFHLRAVYLEGNQFWYKPHCPHTCSNTLLKSLMVIRKLKVLWINDGTIKNVRSPSLRKTIYKCVHICFYTDSFIDWLTFFLLLHSCQSGNLITICRERKRSILFSAWWIFLTFFSVSSSVQFWSLQKLWADVFFCAGLDASLK